MGTHTILHNSSKARWEFLLIIIWSSIFSFFLIIFLQPGNRDAFFNRNLPHPPPPQKKGGFCDKTISWCQNLDFWTSPRHTKSKYEKNFYHDLIFWLLNCCHKYRSLIPRWLKMLKYLFRLLSSVHLKVSLHRVSLPMLPWLKPQGIKTINLWFAWSKN